MADFVAAGLAGPAAIAVDLARHFLGLGAVDVDEEADALLALPALGVEAGVHHQPAGAEGERLEIAEPPDGEIVIDAEFVRELLGIERPAFRIGVEREHGADERQLVRIFALPDMARDRLVEGEVGKVVLPVEVGGPEVDPELAGDAAVDRAGAAIGTGRAGLFLGGQAADLEVALDQRIEGARQLGADLAQPFLDIGHDLGAALVALGELVARVLRQRLHAFADRALGVADLLQDRVHAAVQGLQFIEAHLMDLLRRHARGGGGAQRP